jgi:choline dehydrogenase
MSNEFDSSFVCCGSTGAVIASFLSEDHSFNVALIKAEEQWPNISLLPIAPAAMQLNSTTDCMYTADPGKAELRLNGRRVSVPRGKMLGGSSGINYMVYVRGHSMSEVALSMGPDALRAVGAAPADPVDDATL